MTLTIDDFIEPEPIGFTCPGCGRYVIGVAMYKMEIPVCGACLSNPGWPDNKTLSKAFDPFGDTVDRKLIKMSPVELECRYLILHAILAFLQTKLRIIEDVEDTTHTVENTTQRWYH